MLHIKFLKFCQNHWSLLSTLQTCPGRMCRRWTQWFPVSDSSSHRILKIIISLCCRQAFVVNRHQICAIYAGNSLKYNNSLKLPVLRIRDVYPGSRIRFFFILDHGSASKNLSILNQKNVSKLSEIWSGLFIPDLDRGSGFFYPSWIPDPGVKKAPDPGSATLKTTFKYLPDCQ